jgi:hypothetical protein
VDRDRFHRAAELGEIPLHGQRRDVDEEWIARRRAEAFQVRGVSLERALRAVADPAREQKGVDRLAEVDIGFLGGKLLNNSQCIARKLLPCLLWCPQRDSNSRYRLEGPMS